MSHRRLWGGCKYCTSSKKVLQIKSDYRELESGFWWFFQRSSLPHCSFKPSLPCNCSPFTTQKGYSWKAKGLQSECKSCPFAIKCSVFTLRQFAPQRLNSNNSLSINDITKTAQNSRISRQRFPCAFNSQFWAVRNANIAWSMAPVELVLWWECEVSNHYFTSLYLMSTIRAKPLYSHTRSASPTLSFLSERLSPPSPTL